uniref:Si:dkey-246g23.2 n=1 Tax=Cyprinus carpio TaxID=7962 RepID=A0A8C1XT47_CYPCA
MEQGSEENMESSWTLLSWLASAVMVFGGAVPYVPQYQEIQRTNNTEGFSTRVCLVLLVANILRIFFWIGKQFELPLLLQSVVMILTMLAMLHLCCSIQSSNRVSTKQHHITDLDLRYFWSWSSFEDYLMFCFAFTLLCAFVTFLFLDWVLFVEALGSLAVMFEAMLGLPQVLQNYNNRSTRGMRTPPEKFTNRLIQHLVHSVDLTCRLFFRFSLRLLVTSDEIFSAVGCEKAFVPSILQLNSVAVTVGNC